MLAFWYHIILIVYSKKVVYRRQDSNDKSVLKPRRVHLGFRDEIQKLNIFSTASTLMKYIIIPVQPYCILKGGKLFHSNINEFNSVNAEVI